MSRPTTPPEWLSVSTLAAYADASPRTVRSWLADPAHPLPHVRIGGRRSIRVRRSAFDEWASRETHGIDVDRVVEDLVGDLS